MQIRLLLGESPMDLKSAAILADCKAFVAKTLEVP